MVMAVLHRRNDQTVNATADEVVHKINFFFLIFIGSAYDQGIAGEKAVMFNTFSNIGKKGIRDVRDDQAYCVTFTESERTGALVGLVIERLGRRSNPLSCVLGNGYIFHAA